MQILNIDVIFVGIFSTDFNINLSILLNYCLPGKHTPPTNLNNFAKRSQYKYKIHLPSGRLLENSLTMRTNNNNNNMPF